jgi:CxxC motif-containing protein (DUF1111 family)
MAQRAWCALVAISVALGGCDDGDSVELPRDHGPIAEGISARLGEPIPTATPEQLAAFERGLAVAHERFDRSTGLGPAFNLTFCGGCHEKPVTGGSAGLYRNFFIGGVETEDGAFFPAESAGMSGGVIRMYAYGEGAPARPAVDPSMNIVGQRNPVPFFGVGLLAELSSEEILKRADPDDADGDGISGKPNYDRGFVGRFGRKAQTVSIEGFIRGPLFNHLGITSDPLSEAMKAALPVDSSSAGTAAAALAAAFGDIAQASAPDEPNADDDGVPDPELSPQKLFDVVSFSMLLAAPKFDEPTEQTERGRVVFDAVGCGDCHTPRVEGPRGPLPVYSDLLLHDMGPEMADGIQQGLATGSEFRTQPLWGVGAVGPYLHDGRAHTLDEAIRWHGGEGSGSRDRYAALSDADRDDLFEFLLSLGGRDQRSLGLLPPDAPVPPPGEYGGPARELDAQELADFRAGRELFDAEFGVQSGAGGPRFNGDSCRACHFDPVIGGSGPRDVNVMRHGILNADGHFVPPATGTVLHKLTKLPQQANAPQSEANIFEHRQTPHLFGLGLIESIPDDAITAQADPDDADGDGISGRVSRVDGGRLGRFGWKAQVPTIDEFVRDAIAVELGMTLPYQEGLTFGMINDNDGAADPELSLDEASLLAAYLGLLGPPPRQPSVDAVKEARGEVLMGELGCTGCHTPSLPGASGPVPLYSDLLLHRILPDDAVGIEDGSADMWEFRTPPLWGLSQTAPYLHSGAADTVDEAISAHDGEAKAIRDAWEALPPADKDALRAFLLTL